MAVLKAQLDFMREYDQRLLNTVYMALGGTFVMWTLINIAAYLTNRRDKEALMREIQDKTAAETIRLSGEITAKANALDEKLALALSANKKELELLIEAKSKAVTDALSAKISSVETQLTSNVSGISRELKEVEYQFASIEALKWKAEKVPANELRKYETMLNISIDHENYWRIPRDLEKILGLVKSIPNTVGIKPDAEQIGNIHVSLSRVPKAHETTVNAIRKIIENLAG